MKKKSEEIVGTEKEFLDIFRILFYSDRCAEAFG